MITPLNYTWEAAIRNSNLHSGTLISMELYTEMHCALNCRFRMQKILITWQLLCAELGFLFCCHLNQCCWFYIQQIIIYCVKHNMEVILECSYYYFQWFTGWQGVYWGYMAGKDGSKTLIYKYIILLAKLQSGENRILSLLIEMPWICSVCPKWNSSLLSGHMWFQKNDLYLKLQDS